MLLPTKKHFNKGFTLVELLVVISIIAILSVIGVTVFSGVQKNARDSRRRADIDAIAKALEINKEPNGYPAMLNVTWFAGGNIPHDPLSSSISDISNKVCGDQSVACDHANCYNKSCWYCVKDESTGTLGVCGVSSHGFSENNRFNQGQWKVCANLENSPYYYCLGNQQ